MTLGEIIIVTLREGWMRGEGHSKTFQLIRKIEECFRASSQGSNAGSLWKEPGSMCVITDVLINRENGTSSALTFRLLKARAEVHSWAGKMA